jgi:hypothetical protein
MKPLSEKLAQLSVEAKSTEERVAKAQNEAKERLEQRRQEARAQAEEALGKVKDQVNAAKGEARDRFNSLQSKVDADFENMRQDASFRHDKFKSWQANNYADDKEADAAAAIDYAIAATKLAEAQTLDAISARAEAIARSAQVELEQPTVS